MHGDCVTINTDEVYRRLRYYVPDRNQSATFGYLRDLTIDYAIAVSEVLPESREKSHWLTVLEDAQMWANKAVALNGVIPPTEA